MEKLSRLVKLQLYTILKGFFPKRLYIKIKRNKKIIIKKSFFSFKSIRETDVEEVITSFIPKYLAVLEPNKSLGQHLKTIKNLTTEREVVDYLYKEYTSLSHKITDDFKKSLVENLKVTKFKWLHNFTNPFKAPRDFEKEQLKKLRSLPSNKVHSVQKKILEEKQELLYKTSTGSITISTAKKEVPLPKFESNKKERILIV